MSASVLRVSVLAAAVVAVGLPAEASAERRIVVLNIQGMESSSLQRAIEDLVRDDHEVISGNAYARAAIKLEAEGRTTSNYRKVAAKLGADGLIETRVRKRDGVYILKLRVRSGSTGLAIDDSIELEFKRRPRIDDRETREALQDFLLEQIEELPRLVVEDRDSDADGDEGEVMAPGRRARLGSGIVMAGASVSSRSLTFSSNDFPEAPQGFQGGFVPGGYVAGELYPMAGNRAERGKLADLGVSFLYDQAVGLQTSVGMVTVPTSQQRYGIGVRYRINLGAAEAGPTVTVGGGYNKLAFEVDPADIPDGTVIDYPNTAYVFFDPGVSIRYPTSPKLAVLASAAGLLITDTGDIQRPEEYGSATVTGVDASAGVEYFATERVVVRAVGRFLKVGMDFNEFPDGDQTKNRDLDPETIDVGGAGDTYMGATVTLGYLF